MRSPQCNAGAEASHLEDDPRPGRAPRSGVHPPRDALLHRQPRCGHRAGGGPQLRSRPDPSRIPFTIFVGSSPRIRVPGSGTSWRTTSIRTARNRWRGTWPRSRDSARTSGSREVGHPPEFCDAVGVPERCESRDRAPLYAEACLVDEPDQDLVEYPGVEGPQVGGFRLGEGLESRCWPSWTTTTRPWPSRSSGTMGNRFRHNRRDNYARLH